MYFTAEFTQYQISVLQNGGRLILKFHQSSMNRKGKRETAFTYLPIMSPQHNLIVVQFLIFERPWSHQKCSIKRGLARANHILK